MVGCVAYPDPHLGRQMDTSPVLKSGGSALCVYMRLRADIRECTFWLRRVQQCTTDFIGVEIFHMKLAGSHQAGVEKKELVSSVQVAEDDWDVRKLLNQKTLKAKNRKLKALLAFDIV